MTSINSERNEIEGVIAIYDEKDNIEIKKAGISEVEDIKAKKLYDVRIIPGEGGVFEFKIKFKKPINWINEVFREKNIISIDFSNFNSSNVTNMEKMFHNCYILEKVNFNNFDTSKVEKMNSLFHGCSKLKEITGINKFNTTKVNNMEEMFLYCKELEYLDLSNFDTSNVENMYSLFSGCSKLKEIKGINKFNTSKVRNMGSMFFCCEGLEYLDLSNFKTSQVEHMESMFYRCNKLKELDISNFSLYSGCDYGDILGRMGDCKITAKDQEIIKLFKNKS